MAGKQFSDISGIGGADSPSDGRAFALWDYDRDGRQDIAVVNSSAPLVQLFRNEIGGSNPDNALVGDVVALRLVGGNKAPSPSTDWSARDGYGSVATFQLGDLKLYREFHCGEGLAAQNSAVMIVGIGDRSVVDQISVRWPSGKTTKIDNVAAGSLVTASENAAESPDGRGFVVTPYRQATKPQPPLAAVDRPVFQLTDQGTTDSKVAILRLYTSMATWCAQCKRHLPQFELLREAFKENSLAIFGIPIDQQEDAGLLRRYVASRRPAYDLLVDMKPKQRAWVQQVWADRFHLEALPSSVVTNRVGEVVLSVAGVPTVSQVRQLLEQVD